MCERHRLIDSCPTVCLHGSLLCFFVNNSVQYFKVDKPKGTSGEDIKETNVVIRHIYRHPTFSFVDLRFSVDARQTDSFDFHH